MQRSRTDSSSVRSVDYNAARATLEVAYRNGSIDRYFCVPQDIVDALEASGSRTTFVNAVLKPGYRCDRLTPPTPPWTIWGPPARVLASRSRRREMR